MPKNVYEWTPAALEFIAKNCQMTAEEMQPILAERFGLQPAIQTIRYHILTKRKEAEDIAKLTSAEVDRILQERLEENANPYFDMLDKRIRQIDSILDGNDLDYLIPMEKSGKGRSNFYYIRYSELLMNLIKTAFELRPTEEKVNIKLSDNDIDFKLNNYAILYKQAEE